MKKILVIAVLALLVGSYATLAYANCGACGVGEAEKTHMHEAGEEMPAAMECLDPNCTEDSLCAHCAYKKEAAEKMGAGCGGEGCTAESLCEHCAAGMQESVGEAIGVAM